MSTDLKIDAELSSGVRRGIAIYKDNPFNPRVDMKVRKFTNKSTGLTLVSKDTGEAQDIAGFVQEKEIDATQFIKLFVGGVKALQKLTSAGTKVFEVLYMSMIKNISQETITITYASVDQLSNPMSEATYRRGISELVSKGFIAPTESQGNYWVNPNFIWNGNRISIIKRYRKASIDLVHKSAALSHAAEQDEIKIEYCEQDELELACES
jgi:hypothetical protein